MIPVLLSGGSGTRLWPVSRLKLPKQFCAIFERTLHASTLERLKSLGVPWIITSEQLRDLTLRDMTSFGIPHGHLVLEPVGRNTAPAIALICHLLATRGQLDEVVGIFPADHLVEDEEAFRKAVATAREQAAKGSIVTLGIRPSYPATGYGYIQIEDSTARQDGAASPVLRFHEKPDLALAEKFLESGHYFWNAGIFIFKVRSMIAAFEAHLPDMWKKIRDVRPDLANLSAIYSAVQGQSIDYGILEKLKNTELFCVPCSMGWSDVGSWDAVAEHQANSPDQVAELSSERNFVASSLNKKYVFSEVSDVLLVDTEDACLITKRGHSQSVKDVQTFVQKKWPSLATEHSFETRPWGEFQVLRDEKSFKTKVLTINPGQQISYQSHEKREEHWLIVEGSGVVILDDHNHEVAPGTYIKIPKTAKHRVRNTGTVPLRFVEVQLGTYFGEDDILRYQDDYQRR